MALCAVSSTNGLVLEQMASQADACAGVVLLQPADVPPNPLAMSVDDGLVVSGAIVTLWCIAWAVRAVRQAL